MTQTKKPKKKTSKNQTTRKKESVPDRNKRLLKPKFLEYYSELPNQGLAADSIGRREETVIEWRKEDPAFDEAIIQAKANWAMKKVKRVRDEKWVLERLLKNPFAPRTEVTGADGAPLVAKELDALETNYDQFGQETAKQIVANEPPVQNQDEVGGSGDVQNESSTGEARSAEDVAQAEPSIEG